MGEHERLHREKGIKREGRRDGVKKEEEIKREKRRIYLRCKWR